jgi:hypothetical protein
MNWGRMVATCDCHDRVPRDLGLVGSDPNWSVSGHVLDGRRGPVALAPSISNAVNPSNVAIHSGSYVSPQHLAINVSAGRRKLAQDTIGQHVLEVKEFLIARRGWNGLGLLHLFIVLWFPVLRAQKLYITVRTPILRTSISWTRILRGDRATVVTTLNAVTIPVTIAKLG